MNTINDLIALLKHADRNTLLTKKTYDILCSAPTGADYLQWWEMLRYEAVERHGFSDRELEQWRQACNEGDPDALREEPESRESAILSGLYSLMKKLDSFEEKEARWLIPGWIPEEQITLLAADGGMGKTTLWAELTAAVTTGRPSILEEGGAMREPGTVMFISTEDSVSVVLRKRLREAGADLSRIITPDSAQDSSGVLRELKFGSQALADLIRCFQPALCIFDPIQGFIPPEVNMASRNAMRDCMAPFISLGQECHTTFLLVAHTNKKKHVSGRYRIADSADLWDIARSVIMMGKADEPGLRYISHEKSSYGLPQQSVLYTIEDGSLRFRGRSDKRDAEFQAYVPLELRSGQKESCKQAIVRILQEEGGSVMGNQLEEKGRELGFTVSAVKRAKTELRKENKLRFIPAGTPKKRIWYTQLVLPEAETDLPPMEELTEEEPMPF